MSAAYDGRQYQTLNYAASSLMVREKAVFGVPFEVVPPSLRPFEFAYDASTSNGYEVLKREDTWRDGFASKVRRVLDAHSTVGDLECVVVELSMPGVKTPSGKEKIEKVYFALECGFLPVRREIVLAENPEVLLHRTDAEVLQRVPTDSGDIFIPIKLTQQTWNENGLPWSSLTCVLDPESLRVNEPIEDADFTLSPSLVRDYFDEDSPQQSFTMPTPESATKTAMRELDETYSAKALPLESGSGGPPVKPVLSVEQPAASTDEAVSHSTRLIGMTALGIALALLLAIGVVGYRRRKKAR
jgi:hypothetical protein